MWTGFIVTIGTVKFEFSTLLLPEKSQALLRSWLWVTFNVNEFIRFLCAALINSCYGNAAVYAENVQPTQVAPHLVTQTVYGFLDFTTTIGNTVMVFSPESAPPPG